MHCSLKKSKAISLTFFFGMGKVVATIGSTFYALDRFSSAAGLSQYHNFAVATKVTSAVSSGLAIMMTRVPEMYDKFSGSGEILNVSSACPNRVIILRIGAFFGVLGYVASVLAGISAYLGGYTLARDFNASLLTAKIIGLYVSLSAFASFAIYSVTKVKNNVCQTILFFSEKGIKKGSGEGTGGQLKTFLATGICVISSGSMFFFSVKHAVPAWLNLMSLSINNLSDNVIAGVGVFPSEITLIFSQVAAVKRYFSHPEPLFKKYPRKLIPSLLFWIFSLVSAISILPQSIVYYEYLDDILKNKCDLSVRIILSSLNGLGASFLYYAFTIRPAIKFTADLTNRLEKNKYSCYVFCSSPRSVESQERLQNSPPADARLLDGAEKIVVSDPNHFSNDIFDPAAAGRNFSVN